jgi:ABC-type amino acid transport system permease subunit
VLASAGALIVLINTAYQDGRADNLPPLALRIAVQVASVLLTPLIVLAVWGLMLRIGQYGLTPDRIIAAACALVGAAYAAGYGLAAVSRWSARAPAG